MQDHPLRYPLANELHARPFPALDVPSSAVYLAIAPHPGQPRDRAAERAHLLALLDRHGADHPAPDATHWSGQVGRHVLKWESHTEFVTFTAFAPGLTARAFDPAEFEVFPADWLEAAPGVRATSAVIRIEPLAEDAVLGAALAAHFVPESLASARVMEGAAVVAGDFRIDPAGHMRFLIQVAPETGPQRVGRILQRLCELETYKSMSMLGLACAREMGPRLDELDRKLTELMADMRSTERSAEATLGGLLEISAELEDMAARAAFRFAATRAYEAIVTERIAMLREERYEGRQMLGEFMRRRFDPAMRTVAASERRLAGMADRAMRAGELLRTRVDVERQGQNQALLASMDRRADLQLQMQRTVEGLSVVAISYYAVSLVGYLAYPLAEVIGLSKGMLTALAVPPVVLAVWLVVRGIRSRHGGGDAHGG
ncbi:DUF3422 family protein [Maritimibacter alkaliphilus]|uniref:DUF3422 family protein n=1 Tax=Maritimibacter alkaliphilus TaxID=404236 RepID=UPI001C96B44B|nr:DUF3422 domain-containing protein [Maritimibacter alkaliphilus]MBY6090182.1 DUF3422 domain-containing protein [Maritimibacter alkaliphilus]